MHFRYTVCDSKVKWMWSVKCFTVSYVGSLPEAKKSIILCEVTLLQMKLWHTVRLSKFLCGVIWKKLDALKTEVQVIAWLSRLTGFQNKWTFKINKYLVNFPSDQKTAAGETSQTFTYYIPHMLGPCFTRSSALLLTHQRGGYLVFRVFQLWH